MNDNPFYTEDVTDCIRAMEQVSLEGNVIPPSWYQKIKTKTGKTALLAINLLADIVYWYRPTIVRDDETGSVISKSKKFKADKLQRQYAQIVDMFGCSKAQAKQAVDLLIKNGLIQREFRTVTIGSLTMNNVMFLAPVPETIKEITFRINTPSPRKSYTPMTENVVQLSPKIKGTNTDTTTKTKHVNGKKPLSEKDLQDANALTTAIIENAQQRERQQKYPHRLDFPVGALRDFADCYNELTGQTPAKSKPNNKPMDWLMVFQEWLGNGYTAEMVRLAYKMSQPNKNPRRSGFSVTSPRALSNTLNEVQGLLATGRRPEFDDEISDTQPDWFSPPA